MLRVMRGAIRSDMLARDERYADAATCFAYAYYLRA